MTDLSQDIKISCHNSVIKGKVSNEGHPWRNWKITLVAMDGDKEVKGKLTLLLDHVDYILHPTFRDPRRVVTKEPYLLQEKGWGEFDMRVVLYFTKNLVDPQVLLFDLNFAQSNYSTVRKVDFPNAPPEFAALLQKTPTSTPRMSTHNKQKDESDLSSQEDVGDDDGPKRKMEESTEYSGYEKQQQQKERKSSSKPKAEKQQQKQKQQKQQERREKPKQRQQESGSSSTSDSEEDSKIRYNSAKKKPVSSNNYEKASSKKSTVLKNIKSEEASPNTSSIPSTPASIVQTDSKPQTVSKKRKEHSTILDEVHVYSVDDVEKIGPIHSFPLDDDTRRRWDIPKCNMKELAKRIMSLNEDQMKKFQQLIIENINDDMDIRLNAEKRDVTIDLYSLGAPFLQKIWDFTEELISSATKSTSKASASITTATTTTTTTTTATNHNEENHNKKEEHGGEEEDGEVSEQGEYHSDEDDYINHSSNNNNNRVNSSSGNRTGSGQQQQQHRPNGYRNYMSDQNERYSSDEHGYHQSDMENDVGHQYNHTSHVNDYHDTSDMDVQDDDE